MTDSLHHTTPAYTVPQKKNTTTTTKGKKKHVEKKDNSPRWSR